MLNKTKKIVKLTLEPGRDALVRSYCNDRGIPYSRFVREALHRTLATCTDRFDIPHQADYYGKLSHQVISVVMTRNDVRSVHEFARRMGLAPDRSYMRILRYAVNGACEAITRGELT